MLTITAIFLFILWAVMFIGFEIGGVVHLLLVLVLIANMLRKAVEKKQYRNQNSLKIHNQE
jgi:hypothetical protein